MSSIRKILLIFSVDTLIVLIAWASLSLITYCVKIVTAMPEIPVKILSIYSFFVVMFFYAFFLILDLCECLSNESISNQ
jgi:hypothetical protein